MAAPVNSTNSIPAGLQMAAVQAQLNAGRTTANSAPTANSGPGPGSPTDAANGNGSDSYVSASSSGNGGAKAATPQDGAPATVASLTAATVAADSSAKTASSSSNGADQSTPTSFSEAVAQLQDYFQPQQTVSLNVDKSSGESIVKIMDAKTKQLILQIPSREVLAMAQKLREQGSPQDSPGILVDQQG